MTKEPFVCSGCNVSYLEKEDMRNCQSRHKEENRKQKEEDTENCEGGNPW